MTERMISNRIRKLKELENQRAELDKQGTCRNGEVESVISEYWIAVFYVSYYTTFTLLQMNCYNAR